MSRLDPSRSSDRSPGVDEGVSSCATGRGVFRTHTPPPRARVTHSIMSTVCSSVRPLPQGPSSCRGGRCLYPPPRPSSPPTPSCPPPSVRVKKPTSLSRVRTPTGKEEGRREDAGQLHTHFFCTFPLLFIHHGREPGRQVPPPA